MTCVGVENVRCQVRLLPLAYVIKRVTAVGDTGWLIVTEACTVDVGSDASWFLQGRLLLEGL